MAAKFASSTGGSRPGQLGRGLLAPAVAGFAKGYLPGRISWDAASQRWRTQVLAYRARRPDVLRDLHPHPGPPVSLRSPAE